ncbi:MAG: hypothetical protein FWD61_20565 [Phycisphaerales bacterium]|nr:hypothetical protein [Phycisphaerales bacterium]
MREELKELLDQEPFEPFHIVTNSGEKYLVENPYNVAPGETCIGLFPPRTNRWITIRLNQMTALESVHEVA